MMRPLSFVLAAVLASMPSVALADPAPGTISASTPSSALDIQLPFRHVTLYTSGVGYFQRSAQIDGDVSTTLYFPIDEVNDVLKSLVLVDEGGGSIQPVTYAAKDPVVKQLQAFSVDLSDNPDRETLFNRLRGAKVTVMVEQADVTGPNYPVNGLVMGVEEKVEAVADGQSETIPTKKDLFLNVLADDGIDTIPFDQIVTFKVQDPQLDSEIREALATVSDGRDNNKRPVKLSFRGSGNRTVDVGYVSEAPVWQSTYRLVLGKNPVLQGWALVQNTSQDDWNNIDLTLVSGRPVSFTQDLYTPLYVTRPNVVSQVAQALSPVNYQAGLPPDGLKDTVVVTDQNSLLVQGTSEGVAHLSSVPKLQVPVASAEFAPANLEAYNGLVAAATVGTTGAKLGDALFTYNIAVPVTIPRQQSAMIPFMSTSIPAQRVGIYNADVNADHPMTGARFKNTSGLHLLGGPITVFDQGATTSYVGDAIMDDTQDGDSRLISYALDSSILAQTSDGEGYSHTLGLKIVKGVLTLLDKEQQTKIYTFRNHGSEDQTIVVEHPDPGSDWHLLEPSTYSEHTDTVYRFDLPVPAAKAETLKVVMQAVEESDVALVDESIENILVYVKQGGDVDPAVTAALQEVARRKREIDSTTQRLAEVGADIASISMAQGRIRENMKVLDHTSALFNRYADELNTQETRLNDLGAQSDTLNDKLAADKQSLSDYLSTLTIGDLPATTTGN